MNRYGDDRRRNIESPRVVCKSGNATLPRGSRSSTQIPVQMADLKGKIN